MKSLVHRVVLLTLVIALATTVSAQDVQKKRKKKEGGQARDQISMVLKKLESLDLTAEQEAKIKKAAEEARAELAKVKEQLQGIDRQKLAEARKKVTEAGKKGKEAQEAIAAELNLTDAQKEAFAKMAQVGTKFRQAVAAVLTPEQREKAELKVRQKPQGKRGKKKQAE